MTDIIEKIAREIRDAHAITFQVGIPEQPSAFHEAMAKAALSVIKEDYHLVPKDKPGSIVKTLKWWPEDQQKTRLWAAGFEGSYVVTKCDDGYEVIFGIEIKKIGKYGTEEEAIAAAQAHHIPRVLSLLNLEDKP